MTISPWPAWTTMLRATSEIAVATSVASVLEKPSCAATARPSARASTMSSSDAIATRVSAAIAGARSPRAFQDLEPLLEVEGGLERLEVQLELHYRHRNVRLDADDHRSGSTQARRQRDRPQRARDERIDDVQRRDIDDDPAGAELPDLLREVISQLQDFAVGQRRLNGGDQVLALLQDRDGHPAGRYSTAAAAPALATSI